MITRFAKVASIAIPAILILTACTTAQLDTLQEQVNRSTKDVFDASAFGDGSVEVKSTRAPSAQTQTISYDPSLFAGATSEPAKCLRVVAKACSGSFAGLAAPFCVKDKAAMCGVFPASPGGDVAECFSDLGNGKLKAGACRETVVADDVKITDSLAELPFGVDRSIYEQYQVMFEDYKLGEYRNLHARASGQSRCAAITDAGRNFRCQLKTVEENLIPASGQSCEFRRNRALNFKQTIQAMEEIGKKINEQCSVRPDVLARMIDEPTLRAYAFK